VTRATTTRIIVINVSNSLPATEKRDEGKSAEFLSKGIGAMKKILIAIGLVASAGAASAADMPQAAPYKAPVVSPAYNWTGFYLGAMGGYGWSDRVTIGGIAVTNADIKGGFAGGTVGFNYQAPGSMFVFGIESDAAWSDIQHTEGFFGIASAQERIKSFGSVTGRLGIAVDSVLLYGKGGYSWAENQISATALGFTASESHFHNGWTIGGGAEWAFAGPWSAKAEYMFARYNAENYLAFPGFAGIGLAADVHTIKAGINYRFGWGAPVVARY
jgi:outer membrane immunogenic protein